MPPLCRAQLTPPVLSTLLFCLRFPKLEALHFGWQCLTDQRRKSSPSPAGSPGNCLEVSFFLQEAASLSTGREGGYISGTPLANLWLIADHRATDSLCSLRPSGCMCFLHGLLWVSATTSSCASFDKQNF